jgi:predicted peroxiredoxin
MGVEALRAGKQALMFLTKEAIHIATPGVAEKVDVPGAPSVAALHEEYASSGGRFYACPVCVKVRDMQNAEWLPNAEVKGMPSVYEYSAGGALVFNY